MKVMLAMSGGVDSSAALVLLKQKYEVIGVTMRLFDSPDSTPERGRTCCSLDDADDARQTASRFNVPHYVYNFKDCFKKEVIGRFAYSYAACETPNPCVDCNKYIKFDLLLQRAIGLGCEYLATGHYARTEYSEKSGRFLLKKALAGEKINPKDQSYFLYNLTQEQLSRAIFPLGNTAKSRTREIARENGLVNSEKRDSQDICFVPDGNYAEFIRSYCGITSPEGNFVDKLGRIVGRHKGLINYTIGQRRGLALGGFSEPIYVLSKNPHNNTITVGGESELYSSCCRVCGINWIIPMPSCTVEANVKTRYSAQEQPCSITPDSPSSATLNFRLPQRSLTSGQHAVFYEDDIVIGGGVIAV